MTEEYLKKEYFEPRMIKYFDLYQEVQGNSFYQGIEKSVRIDYLIKPKQILINSGFYDCILGVECKVLGSSIYNEQVCKTEFKFDGNKFRHLIGQANSYINSRFRNTFPVAILLFTDLNTYIPDYSENFTDQNKNYFNTILSGLHSLNIGCIDIGKTQYGDLIDFKIGNTTFFNIDGKFIKEKNNGFNNLLTRHGSKNEYSLGKNKQNQSIPSFFKH